MNGRKEDHAIDALNRMLADTYGVKIDNTGSSDKGAGIYSGLIVSILGVVNVGAMAFVATAIIYMWGIFAGTTAHEGNKLGGSMYNSLWVPIRHACSFSLTVPILNGLSMMQIAIMACVGLSINFANKVWDASGSDIIEHAHTGIINSSAPMIETEVRQMIPMMFESAVIQMLEAQNQLPDSPSEEQIKKVLAIGPLVTLGNRPGHDVQIINVEKAEKTSGTWPGYEAARLYLDINHADGAATMAIVPPTGIPSGNFGKLHFEYPKRIEWRRMTFPSPIS